MEPRKFIYLTKNLIFLFAKDDISCLPVSHPISYAYFRYSSTPFKYSTIPCLYNNLFACNIKGSVSSFYSFFFVYHPYVRLGPTEKSDSPGGVWHNGVLHTAESDSAVSWTPRSLT